MKPKHYELGMLIKYISENIQKEINNDLRNEDLTSTQGQVLIVLFKKEKDLSFKELEKIFKVTQPTMAGLLTRLEKKNLINIYQDPNDKRSKIVSLSENGLNECKKAEKRIKEINNEFFSSLNNDEKLTLKNLLLKICENQKRRNI